MVEVISTSLTRGKSSSKTFLFALALIVLTVMILSQNAAASEDREVINASDILAKISRGELVEYSNCKIIGDLVVNATNEGLKGVEKDNIKWAVVESPISIKDSTFQGEVIFNPIYFNDTVEFKSVTFESRTSFYYAIFTKPPNFQESTFRDVADFSHATFNEGAHFSETKFIEARFLNATFEKSTSFDSATFGGRTVFCNVIFTEKVDFLNSSFDDFVDFNNATFYGSADFPWVTFNDAVSFKLTKFESTADFIPVSFNGEAHFQNAHFNDTADFQLAKFKDRTYFTNAVFNDSIDFSEADIFQTMKIRWSQLDGKLVYDDYFYQSLLRNFEALGQSEDWRAAYYEYHVEKRKQLPLLGFKRPLEWLFLDVSCGYGVKPLKTIRGAFIVIGLFAVLYGLIEEKESVQRLGAHSLKGKIKEYWRRLWRFVFLSVGIFTALGILDNWKTGEKRVTCFRILVIVEVFLGWLLMILFVISLTLTYIK